MALCLAFIASNIQIQGFCESLWLIFYPYFLFNFCWLLNAVNKIVDTNLNFCSLFKPNKRPIFMAKHIFNDPTTELFVCLFILNIWQILDHNLYPTYKYFAVLFQDIYFFICFTVFLEGFLLNFAHITFLDDCCRKCFFKAWQLLIFPNVLFLNWFADFLKSALFIFCISYYNLKFLKRMFTVRSILHALGAHHTILALRHQCWIQAIQTHIFSFFVLFTIANLIHL